MANSKNAGQYFLDTVKDMSEDTSTLSPYQKVLRDSADYSSWDALINAEPVEDLHTKLLEDLDNNKTIGGATGSTIETILRPIAVATHAVTDGITNIFSDVETGSSYDLSENEQALYSTLQNVPRWGATAALAAGSAMTGGVASVGLGLLARGSILLDTVTSSREVYKGIYEDALSKGLSEADAKNSAAWGMAMSMPFEYLGDRYIGRAFSKASAKRIEKKLIASGAAERVANGKGIKVIDPELAEEVIQQEVSGVKPSMKALPAPSEGEVASGEISDFISLSDIKEKLPIQDTIDKIKGKIPTKEEWEALKTKLTDTSILEKFKGRIPTKEEWEALKATIADNRFVDKIKGKIPTKDEWGTIVEKFKHKLPTKEEWEALKTKLKDSDLLTNLSEKVPTKEEWEAIIEKLKQKVPTKEEWKAFVDNSAFKETILDNYNKFKQFAKDTTNTISAKKAEFIAARQAAQKANLHIKNPELYNKILREAEKGRGWRELFESAVVEGSTEGIQGRLENLGVYKNDPNMAFEDIFEGTAQDVLLGAAGAGVLHGIAKGIGKSPIGKFSAKRIAEMHRRRFNLDTTEDKTSGLQDDFYNSHIVVDSDTKKPVAWEDVQDDKEYDLLYSPTTSDFIQAEYSKRGQNKSDRALAAESDYIFSIKDWNKDNFKKALQKEFTSPIEHIEEYNFGNYYTLPEDVQQQLIDFINSQKVSYLKEHFLNSVGWHHTGKNLRQTSYYSLDINALLEAIGRPELAQHDYDTLSETANMQLDHAYWEKHPETYAPGYQHGNAVESTINYTGTINPFKSAEDSFNELQKRRRELRFKDIKSPIYVPKQIPTVVKKLSGRKIKQYETQAIGIRVNPETNDVVIPADIEYEGATGTLTISEDGTTTITPNYETLSNDPVKAEEQAVEQTDQTRAAIMRDEGVSEKDVERQSPMPGAANRETFGKLSEGSKIQDDIIDKPDTVESEDSEDEEISNYIARKVDRETDKLLTNYKAGKPKKGKVSKNHVMSAIVKFAKKYLDINIDPTIKTEGNTLGKPAQKGLAGQVHSGKSILKIRDASDARSALHELAHYLFNRGRRLTTTGFRKSIGRVGTVSAADFANEMVALYNGTMLPNTLMQEHPDVVPATTTWDEWTSNESDVAISKYPTQQIPEEIFVEAFARYVADQGNFRQQFEQYAPKTYRAFQDYLTKRNMHDAIKDITIVYKMYAEQDIQTREAADTNRQRPNLFEKIYDYIQEFIGDRQHIATIISKTIDNVAGHRHIEKELEGSYKKTDRFERVRGHAASAVKAFISGNGLRFGGGDLLGSKFRNYESILRNVQTLSTITKPDGSTLNGVERFDAYLVAKNTVGETVGNTKTMHEVEQIAYDLGQDLRTTHQDIITIKRTPNYDWSNSKYAPYKNLIEHYVRSQAEWKQTPMTLKEAYDIIETEEVSPDFNKLNDAFNDYQTLWESVQNYVSAMSPSMDMYVTALRTAAGAYYTPLMRELISNPSKYNAVITEREGSDRPSYSSIENTSAEIEALINAGLRAYTKDLLVSMAQVRDSGVYIQEVLPPQEAISMEQIKEAIKKAVYKSLPPGQKNIPQNVLDALDVITVNTIFITNPNADVTGNVFSVVTRDSKGKAQFKFYKADQSLLQMLSTNGDVDNKANYLLQGLNYFNKLQKNWFTRYSLRFIFYTNPIRDAFTASFRGNRLLFKTGNKYLDNNWLNAIAGSLQGMSSSYMMWLTNPEQWQQYEDAMSAIGMSTNQLMNEYNAILSRTKPSTNVPQGSLGFLTSPGFKKFLERVDASDLIVRISELEYLLKNMGVDKEELYLSKDRVNALCLSKNKLESLGLKYDMIEQVLTNDQRTIWNNTNSSATLSLNLTDRQIKQIESIVKQNNVRTERAITEEQLDTLNREVALCTTDFLRHGKWSDKLNILMLFSRAGINGTAQMATWIDRRRMQGRSGEVYGKIASAAILGWLYTSLFGDDDEDEEEMWNSLRFKFGDVSIDLPVLPEDLLGWNMGKALANGDINGSFVKHFAASINPIKSAGFAGLLGDLLTEKKVSRVGWDDFAEPIVPPYLKQKYGNELDKIVTYNTGIVARALPNIFGMTPAHWQYIINNMGFGKLVKSVESSIGVDKSILLPDGSIIPTGHGSLDYVAKQVGINKPLYKTRYERKLDELFQEATTEHSMNPDDEDAKAKYLLLYNAVHLQQNLNKLKFYATNSDQHKRLVAMVGETAKTSYETITGNSADLYKLRAANKRAKAAIEATQAQLKETGEGSPVENLQEAEKTVKVRRPKKEKKK